MKRFLLISFSLLLSACSDGVVQETLGLNREAPDEFTVVSRPPLTVPPDFSLRPPRPGAAPLGEDAQVKAKTLLTGKPDGNKDPAALESPTVETAVTPVTRQDALSKGDEALLKRAGADKADATVRDRLNRTDKKASDASLLDKVAPTDGAEPVVNAEKEAARLKANKAAGKSAGEGDVPVVTPKPASVLDRVF